MPEAAQDIPEIAASVAEPLLTSKAKTPKEADLATTSASHKPMKSASE